MKKIDLKNLLIVPSETTSIKSRTEINPYYKNGYLPIITAPMDTVVSKLNYQEYVNNKINVCFPRSEFKLSTSNNITTSFSLDVFIKLFIDTLYTFPKFSQTRILIDVANGHMDLLLQTVIKTKELYGDTIFLMVGNIANPETFIKLSDAGADAIRCGIGNGNGCLTTQQLGVGYPNASLIKECYEESCKLKNPALIIADGGIKDYSDIIKSLALGADYVMLGSILNKSLESCGKTTFLKYFTLKPENKICKWLFKNKFTLMKSFRGMSTKEVQKSWGNNQLKTSEGVVRERKVEYTLEQWTNNFTDYLKSAMSYTDTKTLEEFIGKVKLIEITDQAYNRFNK